MPAWIKSASNGYFVGEFLGLCFWELSNIEGEQPVEFNDEIEAREYLATWETVPEDISVTLEPPRKE